MEDNCKGPLIIGKGGMNEMVMGLGSRNLAHSPDSDCNSNHHHPPSASASVLSNTSSQDIDFIQDNSDYQWFLDYNYRDNHHTSILSLADSYEAGDLVYYDALAKNMDANLAEIDMDTFRTEDIHALLTNLPPMCTADQLSQETHRQGESYASVTGSMMGKFDFDSSGGPSTSQEDSATSMSICKSELLFSPVKEVPMPGANFSVDSLDCEYNEQDIMLTCQANKDNYTIAFEGSCTMYSEDSGSDYHFADKSDTSGGNSAHWFDRKNPLIRHMKGEGSMTRSDSGSFTTWSKLKKRCCENQSRRPSGNNNNSSEGFLAQMAYKSQSMPNLYKQKLRETIAQKQQRGSSNLSNSSTECCTIIKRKPVKVFDIQHQRSSSSILSDMATSIDGCSSCGPDPNKPNFNLVKLFMKQKSISAEGMSTGLDQSIASDNWQSHSGQSGNPDQKPKPIEFEDSLLLLEGARNVQLELARAREESLTDSVKSANNNTVELDRRLKSRSTNTRRQSVNNSSGCSSSSSTFSNKNPRKVPLMHLMNKSIQTSTFELKPAPYKLNCNNTKEPVRIIEPSFLNKLKKEGGEIQKPVYVLYPNYVLPNLDFLDREDGLSKVFLMPQQTTPKVSNKSRPFSCNDLEALKKRGFSHVKDWESLNLLLPDDCKEFLSGVPEIAQHIKIQKPSLRRLRPASCDCTRYSVERTNSLDRVSSSSSSGTQPSSGYRGSSSQLSESNSPANNYNPLFVYKYDSVTSSETSVHEKQRHSAPPLPKRGISLQETVPPRPPLPRGILRKGIETKQHPSKRYSMYEVREEDIMRHKRLSETEDEGVDAGTSSSSLDEPAFRSQSPLIKHDVLFSNISTEELAQLEEFLKMSGISTSEHEDINEESMLQLRSYVSKFLSLKINQDSSRKCVSFAEKVNVLPKHVAPNNSPNVSALLRTPNQHTKLVDQPICEEGESTPENCSPLHTANKTLKNKSRLIDGVSEAVDKILQSFASATNQVELNHLGDSNSNPNIAKLALNYLCPALYAILSDGLKSSLETSFGAINNSVWQVVEASAQQGPLTKALNELVMRINGEDVITEGLVKFNAFVFGLLNVRSLDAWFSYLRTRESILKKHYDTDSLFLMSHTAGTSMRVLIDNLITALQPLALFPFQLDLLFEYRQLHQSLRRMDSYQQPPSPTHKKTSLSEETTDPSLPDLLNSSAYSKPRNGDKQRPRSYVDSGKASFKLGEDINSAMKRRWSGINLTNKLFTAYNRLGNSEEEYTDSLENPHNVSSEEPASMAGTEEPESLDSNISDDKPLNGRKFKKLQRRWEMLSTKESPPESPTHATKSKIPRPVISPSNSKSGIPVPVSPTSAKTFSKINNSKASPTGSVSKKPTVGKNAITKSPARKTPTAQQTRTSRLDQLETDPKPHAVRPSSLPYKPITSAKCGTKTTPPRRAVSTSVNRKPIGQHTQLPKVVRTLSHRLPSESGHLSYNEGERLKVVLEVDEKWLLCCRGSQKGLVPKSAVIADTGRF